MSRGIRTVSDLRGRCRVDDEASPATACWHWRGARDGNGTPSMWLPALRRRVTLGTAACYLRLGREPLAGEVWHCTCDTKGCANPWHRKAGNRSSQMLAAQLQRDVLTRTKIARGKRAASTLSDAACAEIRASAEPLRVLAEAHGISMSHASLVRRGVLRRPLLTGASVFALAGMSTPP